ncbi:MAG: Hpt domain-containing protein [Candidatus Marinimicrobia bacterium]|nr:Hpt domain-containing protein [Candidatus Neomarinimicrobiota bacterium]
MNDQFIKPDDSLEIDPHFLDRLRELGGPKLISELITMYLTRGSDLLDTIVAGIESQDFDSVKNASHSLISSAGNLGGKRVSKLSIAIEAAAMDEKVDILDDLKPDLILAQDFFQHYLQGAFEQL